MTADTVRPPGLRVVSANVRIPHDTGDNAWPVRRPVLAALLRGTDADVIGVQELKGGPAAELLGDLPELRMLGRDRFGGSDDEHGAVLYRPDRLDALEVGDFWLSDTPDEVASVTWGTVFPRMVTWVRFRHTASGREFLLANTHFPWREVEDIRARELSAELIADRLPVLAGDLPTVLMGDFNTRADTTPHALLAEHYVDAYETTPGGPAGPEGTFHDFTGVADDRIDWILTRGFAARSFRTIDTREGTVWPSDHFPIQAELDWA